MGVDEARQQITAPVVVHRRRLVFVWQVTPFAAVDDRAVIADDQCTVWYGHQRRRRFGHLRAAGQMKDVTQMNLVRHRTLLVEIVNP